MSEEAWHLLVHSPHVYFRLPAQKKLACYKPYLHFHSIYFISISFNMWWTEYRFASHPSDKSFLISSFSGIHFERHTNNNYTLQHIKVYFWVQKVQFQIFVVLVRLWRYVTRILFATVNFETNIQDIPEMISGRKHQESKLADLGRKNEGCITFGMYVDTYVCIYFWCNHPCMRNDRLNAHAGESHTIGVHNTVKNIPLCVYISS